MGKEHLGFFIVILIPFLSRSTFQLLTIHGLTNEFLSIKPKIKERVNQFLDLIKNQSLIAHQCNL